MASRLSGRVASAWYGLPEDQAGRAYFFALLVRADVAEALQWLPQAQQVTRGAKDHDVGFPVAAHPRRPHGQRHLGGDIRDIHEVGFGGADTLQVMVNAA